MDPIPEASNTVPIWIRIYQNELFFAEKIRKEMAESKKTLLQLEKEQVGTVAYSAVEPELEPDFLARAVASEKASAPALGCCCLPEGYCGGKVATILVKFSHISTIYTQIERKDRYT